MDYFRSSVLFFALLPGLISCSTTTPDMGGAIVVGSGLFISDTGQTVRADYLSDETATLTFSDGSTKTLTRAMSGSGARYTSGNSEWWEHQGEATFSVGSKPVFFGRLKR